MDCYTKKVVIDIEGQKKIVLVGERKVVPSCLISAVIALQLIRDGGETYLANIIDTTDVSPGVKEVPVVSDFPDV